MDSTDTATPAEATEAPDVAAPEAEAPETVAEAATEAPPAEPEAPAAEEPETEEKRRRAGGWQRKIERLERALEEKDALLSRALQHLPEATGRAEPQAATPEAKAAQELDRFLDQKLAQRDAQIREAAAVAQFQQRWAQERVKHADFDEVASTVDFPTNSAAGQAILTSEHGPAIMYQLASNPDELARIRALPPLVAAREIGRLEEKLASSTAAPKATPKVVTRKPAAPAPITPVTARGPSTVKPVEQMSYDEYSAWRRSQSKR